MMNERGGLKRAIVNWIRTAWRLPGKPDEDEPRAWPSADRQKMETTANREPDVRPPPDMRRDVQPGPAAEDQIELPAPGYPNSEEALTAWFCRTYFRPPSERELGVLINAMDLRDSTPPLEGPEPDPQGWETTPSPPATRR
jgi:hypothetical protein